MRLRNPLLPAGIVAAGLVWLACSHKEYSEPGPPDGSTGDDGQPADSPLVTLDVVEDTFECNPCLAVCDCTPGDTFYNPGTCETVTCNSGTWGGESCIGLGCPESGPDEAETESDGGFEASDGSTHAGDAATDGPDGAPDAASDGAVGGGD